MDIKTFTGILRAFLVPDSCLPGSLRVGFILKHSGNHAAYIRFFPLRDHSLLLLYGHVRRVNPIQMNRLAFSEADASDGAIQDTVPLSFRELAAMGQVRVNSRM